MPHDIVSDLTIDGDQITSVRKVNVRTEAFGHAA